MTPILPQIQGSLTLACPYNQPSPRRGRVQGAETVQIGGVAVEIGARAVLQLLYTETTTVERLAAASHLALWRQEHASWRTALLPAETWLAREPRVADRLGL
jgi:hypothetical protein